jgi:hypothetical protein
MTFTVTLLNWVTIFVANAFSNSPAVGARQKWHLTVAEEGVG